MTTIRDSTDEIARLKNLVRSLEDQNNALRSKKPHRPNSSSSNASSVSDRTPSPANQSTPKKTHTPKSDVRKRRKNGNSVGNNASSMIDSDDDILDLTSSNCELDDSISWLYVSPAQYNASSSPSTPAIIRSKCLATFDALGERRPILGYVQGSDAVSSKENSPPINRQLDYGYQSQSSPSGSSNQLSSNQGSDTARTETPSSTSEACSPTDYSINSRTFTRQKRSRRVLNPEHVQTVTSNISNQSDGSKQELITPNINVTNAEIIDGYKTYTRRKPTTPDSQPEITQTPPTSTNNSKSELHPVERLRQKDNEEIYGSNGSLDSTGSDNESRPLRKKTITIEGSDILAAQRIASTTPDISQQPTDVENSSNIEDEMPDEVPELRRRSKRDVEDLEKKSKRESLDIQTLARMQEESLRESFTALRKASMSPVHGTSSGRQSPALPGRQSPSVVGRQSPVPSLNLVDLDSSSGSTGSSRNGSFGKEDMSGSGTFRVKKHSPRGTVSSRGNISPRDNVSPRGSGSPRNSGRSSPVTMNGDTPIIHKPLSTPPSTGPSIKSSLSPRAQSGLPKPRSSLPTPKTKRSGGTSTRSGLKVPTKR